MCERRAWRNVAKWHILVGALDATAVIAETWPACCRGSGVSLIDGHLVLELQWRSLRLATLGHEMDHKEQVDLKVDLVDQASEHSEAACAGQMAQNHDVEQVHERKLDQGEISACSTGLSTSDC